ncbi:hypothetical protein ACKXGF_05035 [Alkalibacillus sp. S2W]|uniref:hypothetical protein n=1 Tax=Alkalibacillus sp. S2W TaxID=3386553 RepID=UPI00398CE304
MQVISFREALDINLDKPVGFYKDIGNGDYDEIWFPKGCLTSQKISVLPVKNYTISDLANGRWMTK